MKQFFSALIFIATAASLNAQDVSKMLDENSPKKIWDYASATFKAPRVVNLQTNETSRKHNLEFNITHRFGDISGSNGGVHTLYGFDNAADIRFSFDYGITDRLMVGIGRAKGINPMIELYDGNLKFKLLRQTTDNKIPLSIALFGEAAISTAKPSVDIFSESSYPTIESRLSYFGQIIIARKFSRSLSVEVAPAYLHRNFVSFDDENDLFSIGVGARMKLTKRFAVVADYFYTFSDYRKNLTDINTGDKVFFPPFSVGLEMETGGHVFTINFTNSTGIIENELIPYTRSSWMKGEFRLGFNISRNFLLGGRK